VTNGVNLLGFTFAVAGGAELLPVTGRGDAIAGVPEIGSAGLIGDAGEHAALLAAFDLPKGVATKLEVVALLIDGEAAVAIDENAIIDAGDEVIGSDGVGAGREPNVWHALEGNAGPGIGVTAAAGFGFTDQVSLIANGLVVLEDAFFDDGEFGGENAVVIVFDGGEAAVIGAVAEDVDEFAAEREVTHFLGGDKAGAGEVSFEAEGTVKFSRVTDRFVDSEPEMAWEEDEIFLARSDGGSGQVFEDLRADARSVFEEIGFGDGLPTGRLRFDIVAAIPGDAFLGIDGRGLEDGVGADEILLDGGTFGGGKILVFGGEAEGAKGREYFGVFLDAEGGGVSEFEFFVHGDGEGVSLELGGPAVAVRLDGCELNGLRLGDGIGFGNNDGFAAEAGNFFGGDDGRCSETPLTVYDDADAEAEAVLIRDKGDFIGDVAATFRGQAVAGELTAETADAEIGVSGALLFGFGHGDGAELFEFRRRFGGAGRRFSEKAIGLEEGRCREGSAEKGTAGGFVWH